MSIPKHIFKQYDIRGLAEEEITEDLAYEIGRVFGSMIKRETSLEHPTIVVGMDMRDTSPKYLDALQLGLQWVGIKVIDVELVSTPAFYFAVGHLQADGGVMVSASHNPAQYNGFKMTRKNAIPVSGDTGIKDLARMIEEKDIEEEREGDMKIVKGIPELAVKAEFVFAGDHPIKKFKIVVDSANGMGAQYCDEFFKLIDADVTRMYWELDGSFPNHEADPLKEENTKDLQAKVLEVGADLGVAIDGDGDRIFFVDEKGQRVEQSIMRGVLAQIMLRDYPGATICRDIRPGKITDDLIIEAGGTPSITRVGHSLIKEQMREVNAPFGGESSGHFFYRFETGTYEGPVTVLTHLLQEMTRLDQSLSEIIAPYHRYVHSGEINFVVDDKVGTMGKLKEIYKDGELSELDGITLTFEDFWFNVRPSNTESKLRLNLEAVDKETMEKRRDEIIELIKGNK